jgi:hypothetical protein
VEGNSTARPLQSASVIVLEIDVHNNLFEVYDDAKTFRWSHQHKLFSGTKGDAF